MLGLADDTAPTVGVGVGCEQGGAGGAGSLHLEVLLLDVEDEPTLDLHLVTDQAPDKSIAGTDPWSVSASPVVLVPASGPRPPGLVDRGQEELHHVLVHRTLDVLLGVHLEADTCDDRAVEEVVAHLPDQ